MKFVVTAWIGESLTGHGSASCIACGWAAQARNYGDLAMRALNHNAEHVA